MTNKQYSTHLSGYNEADALQQLLVAASKAQAAEADRLEANFCSDTLDEFDQFTITVGGVQTAFYLGAPQYQALCDFVKSIAAENLYAVDLVNLTVK